MIKTKTGFLRVSLFVMLVSLLTIAFSSCSSDKKELSAQPEIIRDVAILSAQRAAVPDVLEAMGNIRAAETAQLSAQIMGNVLQIRVREGDRVKRGDVLAVLDDSQLRAGLDRAMATVSAADHEAAAADADYGLSNATLNRYQSLYEKKSVSPQEFDEVKARSLASNARREMARSGQAQAKAAMFQARTMFDYTRIRAPFDGVVTEKRVDAGTLATPGMPLLTMEGSGRFRLEATVDESNISVVKVGTIVPVRIDALGSATVQGKVVQILPSADQASRSFTVKIELPPSADIRSGLFGRALFVRGQRESIVVPRAAVVDRGQLQGVYVLDQNQIANLRYVTVGRTVNQQIEVLSGLQGGEMLVSQPGERELGGKRIEVRQ